MNDLGAQERARSNLVRDWLFLLLRYAVTLEEADHAALLAAAAELDRSGSRSEQPAFDFFTRTSMEFCLALGAPDKPELRAALRRLLNRVDDRRLRRVLQAAITEEPQRPLSVAKRSSRDYLWKGLAKAGEGSGR